MAGELAIFYQLSKSAYAIIRSQTTSKIYDVGDEAMEAIGTWNDARAAACDVALTDRGGGLYSADFPTLAADSYYALYFEMLGETAAITDKPIGRKDVEWTGTAETTSPSVGTGKALSDLKSICYYHGWNDTTTLGEVALTRFINNTLYMLCSLAPWPEYHKRDGTVTLVAADDDYLLTETNIAKIGPVIHPSRSTPLTLMPGGVEEWMEKTTITARASSGTPREYAVRKYESSGLVRMELLVWPNPAAGDADDVLYYPYWIMPDELSLATDKTDWPNYRLWLLEEALELRLAAGDRDSGGVALHSKDFMAKVTKALGDSRVSYMPIRITQTQTTRGRGILEILPEITS